MSIVKEGIGVAVSVMGVVGSINDQGRLGGFGGFGGFGNQMVLGILVILMVWVILEVIQERKMQLVVFFRLSRYFMYQGLVEKRCLVVGGLSSLSFQFIFIVFFLLFTEVEIIFQFLILNIEFQGLVQKEFNVNSSILVVLLIVVDFC